ncbi:hypothetical protein BCF11_4061 [Collimonas sp. PA-H2]|nr:hypothetical protein BCF11_4061 [Collimonas sp. PA-H2]
MDVPFASKPPLTAIHNAMLHCQFRYDNMQQYIFHEKLIPAIIPFLMASRKYGKAYAATTGNAVPNSYREK